jgi:hypothetical protein
LWSKRDATAWTTVGLTWHIVGTCVRSDLRSRRCFSYGAPLRALTTCATLLTAVCLKLSRRSGNFSNRWGAAGDTSRGRASPTPWTRAGRTGSEHAFRAVGAGLVPKTPRASRGTRRPWVTPPCRYCGYLRRCRLHVTPARPTIPTPRRSKEAGSGTVRGSTSERTCIFREPFGSVKKLVTS